MKLLLKSSVIFLLSLFSNFCFAIEVTFVNPGKQGERFWDMVTETMKAAAEDFDINLEVLYAQRNRLNMTKLGVEVTQRLSPPDYLILVNEEQAAEKILQASKGKDIRILMLLNDFLPEQQDRIGSPASNPNLIGSIVPDNFGAGQRMMQALQECASKKDLEKPLHMLAIGGDQLTPASIDRNNGALSVIKNNPEIHLDRFLYANWNQQEAEQLTTNYLQWTKRNNITPTAIWSANDPIAMGAWQAMLREGLSSNQICLVGLNWSADGLKMVKQGDMLLTDGGHFLAGAWSMVLLHDHHNKRQQNPATKLGRVSFQMQSIDQHNIDQYLEKLGDENWNIINFKGFSLKSTEKEYSFTLDRVLSLSKE